MSKISNVISASRYQKKTKVSIKGRKKPKCNNQRNRKGKSDLRFK